MEVTRKQHRSPIGTPVAWKSNVNPSKFRGIPMRTQRRHHENSEVPQMSAGIPTQVPWNTTEAPWKPRVLWKHYGSTIVTRKSYGSPMKVARRSHGHWEVQRKFYASPMEVPWEYHGDTTEAPWELESLTEVSLRSHGNSVIRGNVP